MTNATLTEIDGTIVPVIWRLFDDEGESLPLYPTALAPWIRGTAERP